MARSTLTADKAGAVTRVDQQGVSREKRERYLNAATYITPAMIGIFIFSIIPILYTLYTSFTNRNTFHFPPAANFFGPPKTGAFTFIGVQNYISLFWDQASSAFNADFFAVMGNTLLYTLVCLALFFVVGLGLALLLNSPYVKAQTFFRTLIILPWAAPAVLTAPIWKFFFNSSFGPIDQILRILGVSNPPNWLGDPLWAWIGVVLVNLWLSYPYFMFITLGALASVPAEMYEAAKIDGAGWWTQLFKITLPLIRPALLPAMILSGITTFQMFNTVWIITAGGPFPNVGRPGATEFVMVYAYHYGVQQNNYGLMSAFAVVVFVLLFAVTMINVRMSRLTKGA